MEGATSAQCSSCSLMVAFLFLARSFLLTLHLQRRDLHTYTHTHIHCVRVCPPYCICRGHFGPIARRDLCQGRGASRAHTSLAARGVDVAWHTASAGRLARKRYGSRPAHGTLRHTHECGRGRRARASERETEVSTLLTCCRAPDWSSQRPHVVIIRVPRVRARREEEGLTSGSWVTNFEPSGRFARCCFPC